MSEPISADQRDLMRALAASLDELFNGQAHAPNPKVGFVLFSFNFGAVTGGRVNYISNANRADMIVAVKEWLARAEGRVAETPDTRQ